MIDRLARVAIVGAGTMGANHARVVAESVRASLAIVVDVDIERASHLARKYGGRASMDLKDVLDCDAVILSTPTQTHVSPALTLLEHGIALLIEKPIATDLMDVERICQLAQHHRVALSCGFVERFNPVIDLALKLLDEPPIHLLAMRHSPTDRRNVGSVVYDLLIHDIDLALLFMKDTPLKRAVGTSWSPRSQAAAEIADCTLQFASGSVATLSASRAGQRKLRSIQILTSTLLLDLDLLRSDVTVYRNVRQEQHDDGGALTFRAETIIDIPFVRHTGEPLALQLDHFLDLLDGEAERSTEVDRILRSHEAAHQIQEQCDIARLAETSIASS